MRAIRRLLGTGISLGERRPLFRPFLERVEDRLLPALFVEPPAITSQNGALQATLNEVEDATTIEGQSVTGAMTYNGVYAGVTLKAQPGDLLDLTIVNQLSELSSNLHTHGLHVSPLGNSDNVLINLQPGESNQYQIQIPSDHPQGLYWYHPHVHGAVDQQIRSGLGGMLVIGRADGGAPELNGFQQVLLGLKTLTTPTPSGYAPFLEGLDSTANYSVNGQINPTKTMAPGEIQVWNIANLSRDSFYRLQLDGHQLHVVALDGNPLTTPTTVDYIDIGPANRVSFMVQAGTTPGEYSFRTLGFQDGDRIFAAESLMTVEVTGAPVNDVLPTTLTPPSNYFEDLSGASLATERTITFQDDSANLIYGINDQTFPNVPMITARLNTVEEWTLINDTYQLHPFHIHQNGFQVMSVNGVAVPTDGSPVLIQKVAQYVEGFSVVVTPSTPPQSQQYLGGTLMDTISIPAKDPVTGEPGRVVIRMKFEDFIGLLVYHCHIPFHEDHGMMGLIQIVPEAPTYALGSNAGEAPRVQVVDPITGATTARFLAFGPSYRGGVNVTMADVNGDGVNDVIVGRAGGLPQVKVIDGTRLHLVNPVTRQIAPRALLGNFLAFDRRNRGVTVAAGYFDGDSRADLVVGSGNGPMVRVIASTQLNNVGRRRLIRPAALLQQFAAFAGASRGGVNVAAGDVNGDGRYEVVAGAGRGSEPRVRVFGGDRLELLDDMLAGSATERGGVFVATGFVKGYAYPDVITGSGFGASPMVKVFSWNSDSDDAEMTAMNDSSLAMVDSFAVNPRRYRWGVRVGTRLDPHPLSPYGTSRDEIVTTSAAKRTGSQEVFARTIEPSADSSHSMGH